MRQNDIYDAYNFVDVYNGNMVGSVNRRPCRDNMVHSCNCNGVLGDNTQNRPNQPYPPMQSQCPTCPPGTRPCRPPFYPPCNHNDRDCDDDIEASFYNTTGQTVVPGGLIPFAFVTGTCPLGANTPAPTNGTIMLKRGLYLISYSVNGISPVDDQTITALPEYQGTSRTEYSRTQTVATAGEYFNLSNTFLALITSDTTLDIKLNITPVEGTATAVTDVSASLTLVKLSDFDDIRHHWHNNCNCR